MFERITPEAAGISSGKITRMIKFLERNGVVLHSLLFMKGEKLFGEYYWTPFHRDFLHRMYSQTKSFVGIAIGILEEEGKLSLDDKIVKYFPDKTNGDLHKYLSEQTVRDMLTMRTAVRAPSWFTTEDPDRTHEYFCASEILRPSGTLWEYDSAGSQVLSSLVERLSGMTLFDFLNEKIFKHLGTFKNASILKTPNGDSWGDSALLCTSRDMLSFGRLLLNGGIFEGKRLIPEKYLSEATSKIADNHTTAFHTYNSRGYGYQIWKNGMGGFSFHGMGSQFTVCIPSLDLVIVCTGDNQGYNPTANQLIFAAIEEFIYTDASTLPLKEDPLSLANLEEYTKSLRLAVSEGACESPWKGRIDGKRYTFEKSPFGWRSFKISFSGNGGVLTYENEQGEKALPFGFGENVFCKFPQFGYSNDTGGVRTTDGFLYDCASSAGFLEENKLSLRIQVIDKYFGNMFMTFAFKGCEVAVNMGGVAEDFLKEYQGFAVGYTD